MDRQKTKRSWFQILLMTVVIVIASGTVWGDESLRYADLGDFKLESGMTMRNCRVAYRILGNLNEGKSNAVLAPTWLAGTTQEFLDLGVIGPGRMIDSAKYYVIAVDSFGNGVSSSPSNSTAQPDRAFPQFSIRDMVNAQYILLTRHLNISRLHAVVGISMGGMQAFQWLVSYPGYMEKIVPIVAAPWLTSNDMLVWSAEQGIIEAVQGCGGGNDLAMKTLTPIHVSLLWTPRFRVANTSPDAFPGFLAAMEKNFAGYNATNWAWQLKAIQTQDIRKDFAGSAAQTAASARAKSMVITSVQDRAVYPETARSFALLLKSETAELTGDCGHLAFLCELDKLKTIVNGFMDKGN